MRTKPEKFIISCINENEQQTVSCLPTCLLLPVPIYLLKYNQNKAIEPALFLNDPTFNSYM